ncbi:Zeta toxin family protein [Coniochaeta hoffmannii]|uniref:Zeta toxin family protein n=1 Tax=Coniochaeta hoffmannii TaxID=91930 RepID=A0AA38RUS3_9PEZI|nr:Zeta toxin family protein [Coniochaeta hoffmannii]
MASAASYILPTSTSLSIFNTEIVPHELAPVLPYNHQSDGLQPLAVLIVGQTGAGKTRLAPILLSALASLGRRHPAHFIADTYKAYHPAYAPILASQPGLASAATGADARRWLTMACEYAARQRLDVLVESACRHPDDFCSLASLFRAAGYRVAVAILAVPEALSRLGILVRFYQDLPEARSGRLPLRLTPRKVHDDSYAGLMEAARFVDGSDAADVVVVVRRGNGVAYQNRRVEGGRWEGEAGAVRALEGERRRPLSREEEEVVRTGLEVLAKVDGEGVREQSGEIEKLVDALRRAGDLSEGADLPELVPLDAVDFVARGLS